MFVKKLSNKFTIKIVFPYFILTATAFVLCIRCLYSFCWSDESFYLALVHRFWLGDRPIVDEWSGTQFYAVFLLPIYTLYMKIMGNNDGIYVFFRIFIVSINYFLSIYIYNSLKREAHKLPSLLGALIYLLYTRANILGASYYSIALIFVTWAVFLFLNSNVEELNRVRMFTIGCSLAISVLALPYLVFVYAIFGIFCFCNVSFSKYRKNIVFILAGTGICAVIYLGYLLSRVTLKEMLEYMPYLFEDAEHQNINPIMSIILWFARIINRYKYTIVILIGSLLYILIKKIQHTSINQKILQVIFIVNIILTGSNVILSYNVIGCVNIALSILAIIIYLSFDCKDKTLKKVFNNIYLPGIILSIVFHLASNTGLDAITVGFVLCGISSPIIIYKSASKIKWSSVKVKRWISCSILIIFIVSIIQTGWLRLFSVYRDDKIVNLTERITQGPAKYLYTTKEHKKQYDEIIKTIENTFAENISGTVVITELVPWAYLCINNPCGAPSLCRFWGGLDEERLKKYYANMPNRFPTYVLAVTPEYGSCRSVIIQGNEIIIKPNERGTSQWLIEKLERSGYDKLNTVCGIVYKNGD